MNNLKSLSIDEKDKLIQEKEQQVNYSLTRLILTSYTKFI
jgi:hypothetical protein